MSLEWLDRPQAVRAGEELDLVALESYLETQLDGESLDIEQFPSGFSNLTYLLRFGGRELVLRRPPFGSKVRSAHDMGREFRVLSALSEVYPKAPRPVLMCEDEEVLGAPFYVMERVQGVILRPRMKPERVPPPDSMRTISRAAIDTLVELHAVDFEAAGLSELGKPEGYVERQVRGWTQRYQAARTDQVVAMDRTSDWLLERLPADGDAALIHNDFKYDNLVLDPEQGFAVRAVLDWEMATLGDPLMDLGTTLGYWVDPDDPPAILALELSPTALPGNARRVEVAERYSDRSGRALEEIVFYYVFGLFKIAVIVQQIYYRYKMGHTQDARFADLHHAVRGFASMAAKAVALGRIDRL